MFKDSFGSKILTNNSIADVFMFMKFLDVYVKTAFASSHLRQNFFMVPCLEVDQQRHHLFKPTTLHSM